MVVRIDEFLREGYKITLNINENQEIVDTSIESFELLYNDVQEATGLIFGQIFVKK